MNIVSAPGELREQIRYLTRMQLSGAGNCLDNAVTERFGRSLKSERVSYRRYDTRHQAISDIIDYIETVYNQKNI